MITGRLPDKILILTLLFVAIPRNRLTYTIISSVLFTSAATTSLFSLAIMPNAAWLLTSYRLEVNKSLKGLFYCNFVYAGNRLIFECELS